MKIFKIVEISNDWWGESQKGIDYSYLNKPRETETITLNSTGELKVSNTDSDNRVNREERIQKNIVPA